MHLKLKALCLVIFAAMAIGVVSAPAASAGYFHSEGAETVIQGSKVETDVLTLNAGTVKCNGVTYSGEQYTATATTIKVTPSYTECTAFGFVNAPIDVNGCTFEYSADNGNTVIDCGASPMTITAFSCQVTITDQTTSGTTYSNIGSGAERQIHTSAHRKIHYHQHSKSFPGCSSGTRTDGTWVSTSIIRCLDKFWSWRGCWRFT